MQGLLKRQQCFIPTLLNTGAFTNGELSNQQQRIRIIIRKVNNRTYNTSSWLKKDKHGNSSGSNGTVSKSPKSKKGKIIFRATRKFLTKVQSQEIVLKCKSNEALQNSITKVKDMKIVQARRPKASAEGLFGASKSKQHVDKLSLPQFRDTSIVDSGKQKCLMRDGTKKCRSVESHRIKNRDNQIAKPDKTGRVSSRSMNLCLQNPISLNGLISETTQLEDQGLKIFSSADKDPKCISSKTSKKVKKGPLIFSSSEMLYPNIAKLSPIPSNSVRSEEAKNEENCKNEDNLLKSKRKFEKWTKNSDKYEYELRDPTHIKFEMNGSLNRDDLGNENLLIQPPLETNETAMKIFFENSNHSAFGMKEDHSILETVQNYIQRGRENENLNLDFIDRTGINYVSKVDGNYIQSVESLKVSTGSAKKHNFKNYDINNNPVKNVDSVNKNPFDKVHTVNQGNNVTLYKHSYLKRPIKINKVDYDKTVIEQDGHTIIKLRPKQELEPACRNSDCATSKNGATVHKLQAANSMNAGGISLKPNLNSDKIELDKVIIPEDARTVRENGTRYSSFVGRSGGISPKKQKTGLPTQNEEALATSPRNGNTIRKLESDMESFLRMDHVVLPEDGNTLHPTDCENSTLLQRNLCTGGCKSQAKSDQASQKNVNQDNHRASVVNQYVEAQLGRTTQANFTTNNRVDLNENRSNQGNMLSKSPIKSEPKTFHRSNTDKSVANPVDSKATNASSDSGVFSSTTSQYINSLYMKSLTKKIGKCESIGLNRIMQIKFDREARGEEGDVLRRNIANTKVNHHSNCVETSPFTSNSTPSDVYQTKSSLSFHSDEELKRKTKSYSSSSSKMDTSFVLNPGSTNSSQPTVPVHGQDSKAGGGDDVGKMMNMVSKDQTSVEIEVPMNSTSARSSMPKASFPPPCPIRSALSTGPSADSPMASSPPIGPCTKASFPPPCKVDSILTHKRNESSAEGWNMKVVFPPPCNSCGTSNFKRIQESDASCIPQCKVSFPPPCQPASITASSSCIPLCKVTFPPTCQRACSTPLTDLSPSSEPLVPKVNNYSLKSCNKKSVSPLSCQFSCIPPSSECFPSFKQPSPKANNGSSETCNTKSVSPPPCQSPCVPPPSEFNQSSDSPFPRENNFSSGGCNMKDVVPPPSTSCETSNLQEFQESSVNRIPLHPPPIQSACSSPSNACEPESICKSKTHTIVDSDTLPRPPIPIRIDGIPKSKPCFPPNSDTPVGDPCNTVDHAKRKLSYVIWLKSTRTYVRNTYFTMKYLMTDIFSSFVALLKARISGIASSRMQRSRKSVCPPATYDVIQSAVIKPKTMGSRQSKLTYKNRSYISEPHRTSAQPIKKRKMKTKVRIIKSVKNVHDEQTKRAVIEEQKRKLVSTKAAPAPPLAYSEVLNIVFNQKK